MPWFTDASRIYKIIQFPQMASSGFIKSSQQVFTSMFIGYALNARSGWTGDLLMEDAEESKDKVASEVNVKRFKDKVLGILRVGEQFTFLCADGSKKKKTEDGPNRHTTNPSQSCSNLVVDVSGCLLGEENDASDLAKEQKDAWEASKASREDHVMNRETSSVHRKESFLILMNCIDVDRHTNDCWNVDGEQPLSGSWIGFTRFKILKKPPPDGHVERRNTNTHANYVQA